MELIRFFAILFLFSMASGQVWASDCEQAVVKSFATRKAEFLNDPRFHWVKSPGRVELHRQPPNIFASELQAFTYPSQKRLPEGLTSDERQFVQAAFDLLRDLDRVFTLMVDVEEDVKERSRQMSENPGRREKVAALLRLMAEYEARYGIGVSGVREPLKDREFLALIAQGNTIVDLASPHLRLHLQGWSPAREGHWVHGVLSHRLQLHLVLRDYERNPQVYGTNRSVLDLYRALGDPLVQARLDWSNTGVERESASELNLFGSLFDTPENNGSSPGFYFEYHAHWPDLVIP